MLKSSDSVVTVTKGNHLTLTTTCSFPFPAQMS